MSVKLRMKRMGRKKIPYYRLIAIDSRRQRDGKELERIGVYNPLPENEVFNVDEEKLFYWLERGAEPSDTVRTLMKNYGLALKWHLKSQGKSDEEIEREFQKWQLLRESKAAAKAEQEKRDTDKSAKVKPEPEQEPEEVPEAIADSEAEVDGVAEESETAAEETEKVPAENSDEAQAKAETGVEETSEDAEDETKTAEADTGDAEEAEEVKSEEEAPGEEGADEEEVVEEDDGEDEEDADEEEKK